MTNMNPKTDLSSNGPSHTPDTSVDVGRRRVLQGTAAVTGVAALFALGAAASADDAEDLEFSKRAVRPPGSVEESEFLARCLRCDRCRSVCHTSVIGMTDWSDGLVRMRTPVLDFRLGHCDFCGLCAEVCPTGAILPFPKETTKVGLAVLTERCIALRTAACRVCEEKCPLRRRDARRAQGPRDRPRDLQRLRPL